MCERALRPRRTTSCCQERASTAILHDVDAAAIDPLPLAGNGKGLPLWSPSQAMGLSGLSLPPAASAWTWPQSSAPPLPGACFGGILIFLVLDGTSIILISPTSSPLTAVSLTTEPFGGYFRKVHGDHATSSAELVRSWGYIYVLVPIYGASPPETDGPAKAKRPEAPSTTRCDRRRSTL